MSERDARRSASQPDRWQTLPPRAWNDVKRAAEDARVRIEPLEAERDAAAVDAVIAAVWGNQPVGHELLRALEHAGCVLLGAWPENLGSADRSADALAGYVLGFVGNRGGLHVHSHMLAVRPELQSRGIGFALKLAQRAWAIESGIPEVRWTYDPMLLGNARFNLTRLGAVAVEYLPNFYGEMQDELNRGQRSDRFHLSWSTASGHVAEVVEGTITRSREADPSMGAATVLLETRGDPNAPEPIVTEAPLGARAIVSIPVDHLGLRRRDPALARMWREAAGRAFASCFDAGLQATAVTRDGRYLFERPFRTDRGTRRG